MLGVCVLLVLGVCVLLVLGVCVLLVLGVSVQMPQCDYNQLNSTQHQDRNCSTYYSNYVTTLNTGA
jgi:hypothetical protein